jgi:hypothetical protein
MTTYLSSRAAIVYRVSPRNYLHKKNPKTIYITSFVQHAGTGIFWSHIPTQKNQENVIPICLAERLNVRSDYDNFQLREVGLTQMFPSHELSHNSSLSPRALLGQSQTPLDSTAYQARYCWT